jgi:membrane protease YdiL (CAAX protease family)
MPTPERAAATTATDKWAARLCGVGPVGILAMLVIPFAVTPLIAAVLVLVWAWLSQTSLRDIGYKRPRNWMLAIGGGIIFGISFKVAMKAIVMPLFGADPVNHEYHYLSGNAAALPAAVVLMIFGAGFGEETVYRGFLFERFGKVFGSRTGTKALAVLLTSVWFAAMHYSDQGLAGAEQALVTGLTFGTIFAFTGSVFFPMFAHAAFDLTAVAMIYWNVEERIAHLVFR